MTLLTAFGFTGSSSKSMINNVFKSCDKCCYPTKEMHRVMKIGVVGYPEIKEKCLLTKPSSADCLPKDMDPAVSKMKQSGLAAYCSVVENPSAKKVHYALLNHLALQVLKVGKNELEQVVEDELFLILNNEDCSRLAKVPKDYNLHDIIQAVKKLQS